jgi:hypothetical protein
MEQKNYERTLLIPAKSEEEAEQKFQTILNGKEEKKSALKKLEPLFAIIVAAIIQGFLNNYEKSNHEKKYK